MKGRRDENDFARHLSYFLTKYLPGQLGASTNTITSYRDTFKLLLSFLSDQMGIKTETVRIDTFNKGLVAGFLDWVENDRHCSISTRNQRLAAIHAFFRYVQREYPESIFNIQQILAIPSKKKPRPAIPFLSMDEMAILFKQPDSSTPKGNRDLVLLAVLYDTGARVQELISLTIRDVRLDKPAVVTLHGKGGKTRSVPIMGNTVELLRRYIDRYDGNYGRSREDAPLFFNQYKTRLTRRGVSFILNQYVELARLTEAFHNVGTITPHVIRHSKAVHMLQSGIPLVYIRDFLGHVSVTTTEVYARADSEMKRKALESTYMELSPEPLPQWDKDGELMKWLQNLCR